ncbi:uncharacterized protein LOC144663367 [Oculina patagonica]
MVDEMLSGKTLNTKASDVRIIRVFISCTFTDTAQESNLLIADVYPYLKLFGRKYGFEFAPSEMRWGIREESSSDHMTSIICMAEIARCQKESQGINYVVFLCDKYGFRPFPARIEASEFEQLLDQAKKDNDPDVNLLSDWFDLNTNLVPPTYMLKPSTQAPKDKWWDIFRKLQMTLRKASRCLKDKERAKWYTVSVTEEEVHRGLLYMDNRDQKTFFYRRKIVDVENKYKDEIAGKFIDKRYSDGSIDTEAQNFLNKLKNETVPGVLHPSNIKDFTVSWGPGITLEQHADYLREFGDHFCSLMVNSMTEAIKGSHVADDVLFEEVKSHAVFCREKADQVIGKEGILEQISSYLEREDSEEVSQEEPLGTPESPLALHGPSGSGKTSIMAKGISNAVSSSTGAVILYRFLGTSMDSTAARLLLRSLCIQIRRIYNEDPSEVANDFKTLCKQFLDALKLASESQPLILFLDSLDQLTDEDNGRNLEWLPIKLPTNVKIVVSTLPEEGGCLNKLQLSLPTEAFVEVTKMTVQDGKNLLESWLEVSNRRLTASQMLEVLNAFNECPYPLFLKIAFETSCTWTSFTPDDEVTLSRTVRSLIDDMFDRLVRIHGNMLVNHALGYLTVAKFGLTANELEDILSCDDDVLNDVYEWWVPPVRRLPPLLWVRIQTDLGPYLVERKLKGGTPVLSWYHRQFREAAEERFVSDPEVRKARHSAIAEYFVGQWAGQATPYVGKDGLPRTADRKVASQPVVLNQTSSNDISFKDRQYNMRKLTELPTALIGAERWQLFIESVCCIPFIEAKCAVGLVYELIHEVKQAARLAKSSGNQQIALSLKEFAQMMSGNVQDLNNHPEYTVQEVANFPDSSAPAKAAQAYLASLKDKPHWLRHVNKPQELSANVLSLSWGNFSISHSIVFSPDGRHFCCGTDYERQNSEIGRVYYLTVWDVETGAQLMAVPSKDIGYYRVLYSPDGSHVACGMGMGEVRILDSNNGAKIKTLTNTKKVSEKTLDVTCLDFSPDGKHLAVGYEKCRIVVWDVEKCEVLQRLVNERDDSYESGPTGITALRFTPNGSYLWSANRQGVHKTWSVESNYKLVRKGICPERRVTFGGNDNVEGEVPGGLFTGKYSLEFPEGNSGDMSLPLKFWDDGRVEAFGKDETGDYRISGTYDLARRTAKFGRECRVAHFGTWEYDAQFEYTPDAEKEDGTCHVWGEYSKVTSEGTYKGKFDVTLTKPSPKKPEEESEEVSMAVSGDVSADSRLAVTANGDRTLKFYSFPGENVKLYRRRKSGKHMVTWIRFSNAWAKPDDVRFHPSNPDVVYACSSYLVHGFFVSTRKRFATYVHGGGITTFAISKHGDRLASMMCSGTVKQLNVKIWDTTSTGAGEKPLPYGRSITALEFSHDGTKLAVIVENCDYVPVLETESGKIITTIEKLYADRFFSNVCFSPDDSQVLISRGQDKNVVIFSVADGQKVDEFKNVYEYEVGRACFSPQGQLAIMGIDQKYRPCSIKIFTFPEKRLIREFEKVDRLMTPCLYFTQDGSKLCAVRRDWEDDSTTVVVLCMKTGNVLQSINPGKYKIEQFCLDVSCTKCIIGLEREICVCDLESGKLLFQFKPQSGIINAIDSFRMDGQDYIVSGSDDKSLKVLDMNTGLQLGQMTCPYRVSAVASVTIPGSSRSYVAVGDQWTFLRILQWM